MTDSIKPFYIAGPTASGKSAVALEIAQHCRGEIVNADAYQVYRGLEILSAAPTEEEREEAPHHLFSYLDPSENCDAQSHATVVKETIAEISARGGTPIVVGGSGLYIKALTHGLANLPSADAPLREKLAKMTPEERIEKLRELDPAGADAMDLHNDRYVTRALEICILTGEAASVLKKTWEENTPEFDGVLLSHERELLYERINHRTAIMLVEGAKDEVAALGELSETAERAIGVREIRAMIEGKYDQKSTINAICQSTRRYAKRQGTWFRKEAGFETLHLSPDEPAASAAARILEVFPRLASPPATPVS